MSLTKCPECGSTNIFFDGKTQEYECFSCGHKWPRIPERVQIQHQDRFEAHFGEPKSREERKKTHKERFGTEELPERGAGRATEAALVARPVWRECIRITTRSANKFGELAPEIASNLGVGIRGWGSEVTFFFPPTRKTLREVEEKLTQLKIPFFKTSAWGPHYIEKAT